jgi:hypothetical protein
MVAIFASPSWRWRKGRQGRLVEKRGLQNEHDSRAGRSDARHTSGETAGYALAHVIGDKAEHGGAIAFGLLSVVALLRPSVRNSFEHFGDEKLRLKLRHVLGYDFPSAHRRNVL